MFEAAAVTRNAQADARAPGGAETRARLIEVAAEHFARHGFEAASQRAIQRQAGVNPASAHYHFGSKEAMYQAVVDTFIHDIQKERVARLALPPRHRRGHDQLRQLLFDYFAPSLAVSNTVSGHHYVVMLARLSSELTVATRAIFDQTVQPVRDLYVARLHELFPAASDGDIREALAMGVTLMATVLTRRSPAPGSTSVETTEADAMQLAEFVAAGFEAWFGRPAARPPA